MQSQIYLQAGDLPIETKEKGSVNSEVRRYTAGFEDVGRGHQPKKVECNSQF